MEFTSINEQTGRLVSNFMEWITSPGFYTQCGLVMLGLVVAYVLAAVLQKNVSVLNQAPTTGPWLPLKNAVYQTSYLLFPVLVILALGIAVDLSGLLVQQDWAVRVARGLAVVFLLYSAVRRFIKYRFIRFVFKWLITPIAILHVFGWLDDVVTYLDAINLEAGNIRISAYGLLRAIVFGSALFWLGRVSNRAGQRLIRNQEDIDLGTREVFAKLFQVVLSAFLFIVLLQIMGINLTALAVFGGALGVGLAFGLQAIASNFISGMIILLDRSLKVGDHIELDDGRVGTIRDINMRSTRLETFDGKDIMVPNEQFITTRFVNWTHHNDKQRYALEFQVAYSTDIPAMLAIVKDVVRSHPQVINEPDTPVEELADAEISGFGDSGINILVEFWMEGIDDGVNRVGGDLLLMIWQALKDNDIEIPFPQRQVKILNAQSENQDGTDRGRDSRS